MERDKHSQCSLLRPELVPSIVDGVSSHVFEDRLLVFSEPRQKLYALNDSAAYIWSCFEDGMCCEAVVTELTNVYRISRDQARSDVITALSEWVAAGLIRVHAAGWDELAKEEPHIELWVDPPDTDCLVDADAAYSFRVSLLGADFVIRCSSRETQSLIRPVFSHLENSSDGSAQEVDVVHAEGGFRICAPFVPPVGRIEPKHLTTTLTQTVLRSAYKKCNFLIAVHAAVLSLGEQCIILSGQSGSGKSTLTAALIRNGFTYYTDEVAVVDRSSRTLVPAPVSLRIKEGGWDIVGAMFPELYELPSHELTDGSRLRYLPPPAGTFVRGLLDSQPARWLVFPRYSRENETAIVPLSRVEAISRLQSTGYDVGSLLDRRQIQEILSWIKTVECFDMTVNRLDEAVSLLRELVT